MLTAVNIAQEFKKVVDITGIILTRVDGDGRGGAALSMKFVTNAPIKFMGTGEKIDELDVFHPERIANRILGMGDVVSLVEKASQDLDEEKIRQTEENLKSGSFSMEDYLSQLRQMKKMGGMEGVLSMLPGVSKIKKQMDNANIDENIIKLNSLNSCQGCLLRNTNFIGADLNNALLSGADFISADLSNANLYNADLEGSSLFGAKMNGSNLKNANLFGSNLFAVNLDGANLAGANLIEADLSLSSLKGVNFSQANLTNANLRGAELSNAILDGAFLCNTLMPWGVDNSSCQ